MSHFAVLVVGNVEYNLAPFHEFECTGQNDEFVQSVDRLAEIRKSYENNTATLVLQRPDGSKVYAFTNKGEYIDEVLPFYDKVERSLNLPEGWEQLRSEPVKDYQTFVDYAIYENGGALIEGDAEPDLDDEHKWGWVRVKDGEVVEVIHRTNPNKKWDWYQIGGRWSGFLKLKNRVSRANSARKGDIDVAGMRDEEGTKAAERWDQACADRRAAGVALDTWMTWKECIEAHEKKHDAAREAYWEQPAVKAMRAAVQARGDFVWGDMDDLMTPRDQYIQRARNGAIVPFALCHERRWAERGEMGLWGLVSREKDKNDWNAEFSTYFESLPDDALITIVDCHI